MNKHRRLSNVDEAIVKEVIVVYSITGDGVEGDPTRQIIEYFDPETGERLARVDKFLEKDVNFIHEWEAQDE